MVSARKNWERFWAARDVSQRYPSVGDVVGELLSVVGDVGGKRVLEVGAGSGRDSVKLAELGAQVFVLDYALVPLGLVKSMAARKGLPIVLVQADARLAPFADGCFDCLFHQGLLEHFRNPYPLLRENHRLLRAGGALLVDVPQRYHPLTLLKHTLMSLNSWFAGWETEFTVSQIEGLLKAHGLEVIHTYGNWMIPPLAYRILREVSLRSPVPNLPLYPQGLGVLERLISPVTDRLRKKRLFLYTCAVIGAVGRKRRAC